MPEKMHRALRAEVSKGAKKSWTQEHKDAYVYGAMRQTGWKPKRERSDSNPTPQMRREWMGKIKSMKGMR